MFFNFFWRVRVLLRNHKTSLIGPHGSNRSWTISWHHATVTCHSCNLEMWIERNMKDKNGQKCLHFPETLVDGLNLGKQLRWLNYCSKKCSKIELWTNIVMYNCSNYCSNWTSAVTLAWNICQRINSHSFVWGAERWHEWFINMTIPYRGIPKIEGTSLFNTLQYWTKQQAKIISLAMCFYYVFHNVYEKKSNKSIRDSPWHMSLHMLNSTYIYVYLEI